MDKEVPGAPKPIDSPPPIIAEETIAFSFHDLLDGYEGIERFTDQRYLIFNINHEYLLAIREFEYHDFQNNYWNILERAIENKATCFCDICTPPFSVIDSEIKLTKVEIQEGKEDREIEKKTVTMYEVWDLALNTQISIHQNHEEDGNPNDTKE